MADRRVRNVRAKGTTFEKEVAAVFEAAGFEVRGLESAGDHLVICRDGLVLASECKRHERLQVLVWWRQCVADAPRGTVPVLTWRQNRTEMLSLIRTADLVRILG